MQTIPLAFFIVMLELAIGSFLVLYALDVRNDTSINFVRFQAVLYLLMFTLLAWFTMLGFADVSQLRAINYNLDYKWLNYQAPTLLWFMLLQILYTLLLVRRSWRVARLVVGGASAALGAFCLLAVGMGYRAIEAGTLGGALTVLGFVSGALAVGGVSTAMLLGHWYLNTPTASGKPLEFATMLTIGGVVAQIAFGIFAGGATYTSMPTPVATNTNTAPTTSQQVVTTHTVFAAVGKHAIVATATTTPGGSQGTTTTTSPVPHGVKFNTLTLIILEYLLGLGIPLGLSLVALRLERERSFQSATGMLYIAVVFAFFGEVLARNLFLQPLT